MLSNFLSFVFQFTIYRCHRYGTANIHLLDAIQYGSSSIRLNISADEPISSFNSKQKNIPSSYNYTALLTSLKKKKIKNNCLF